MADRTRVAGKFVWFEHASRDTKRAKAFHAELFGWKAVDFPVGGTAYEMIFAGATPDTMIGGYAPAPADGERARWIASVSVADVDAAVSLAIAGGGRVLVPPRDLPRVGRAATIADPHGAELALFTGTNGDPPDAASVPTGRFFWNELHTPDPDAALGFYAKVVGYEHTSVESPAGPYHVLVSSGVERGGITSHLPPGVAPHWLPFVHVDDVDAVAERAGRLGARIHMAPKDIMDIGRLSVLEDPTGAVLAVMKPNPRAR